MSCENSSDLNYVVSCTISGGRGRASFERSAEVLQLEKQAGVVFFPGSLNLLTKYPVYLLPGASISPAQGHMFFHAKANGLDVYLNRWQGSPAHVFEAFSPEPLRSSLGVENGSMIKVDIPIGCVDQDRTSNTKNGLVWIALWRFREELFYLSDWYPKYVKSGWRLRFGRRANQ